MIIIYDTFLRFFNIIVLLRLFWVVICFIVPSFKKIWRSSIFNDTVVLHVWSSSSDKSMRSWSIESRALLLIFIWFFSEVYTYFNFWIFCWYLNRLSWTLFTNRSCWSRFLLFLKWYINSFIRLQNTEMAWSLPITIAHISFVSTRNNDITLYLIFLFNKNRINNIPEVLLLLNELICLRHFDKISCLLNQFFLHFSQLISEF